jgi:hypothetical protein
MPRNGEGGSINESENLSETPGDRGKGMADLILKLVKEILQRNHGMRVETHEKNRRLLLF